MTPILFDRQALLQTILDQFRLDRDGDHGPAHWARVRKHAMTIGRARGADLLVVELFSFLHDSQRENEYTDTDHGERAAAYAESLNRSHYSLTGSQLDKLCHAIRHHSGGRVHPDETIQSCWDGDRLDLGRVGIKPHKDYLSGEAAKLIARAYKMSKGMPAN
jgi:uncharacterized protein